MSNKRSRQELLEDIVQSVAANLYVIFNYFLFQILTFGIGTTHGPTDILNNLNQNGKSKRSVSNL
jgi:hypothetical protein